MNELCWDPCLVGERFIPVPRKAPFGRVPPARCCEDPLCCSPEPACCSPHRASCSPTKDCFARQDDSQSELDIKMPKTFETHILDHMRCTCIACMKFACMWRQGVKKTLRSKIRNKFCSNNLKTRDKNCRRPQKCTKKLPICPKRNVSPRRSCSPQYKPCFQGSPQIDRLCSPRLNQRGCCKFFTKLSSPVCGCPDPSTCRRGRYFLDGETHDGYLNVAMDGTLADSKLCAKQVENCPASPPAKDDCVSYRCCNPGYTCRRHEAAHSKLGGEIERQGVDKVIPAINDDFAYLDSKQSRYFPQKVGSDQALDSNIVSEKIQKDKDIHYSRSQQWYRDMCCTKDAIKGNSDLNSSSMALKTSDVFEGLHLAKELVQKLHDTRLPESMISHTPYMDITSTGCMGFHDNSKERTHLDDEKPCPCHLGCSMGGSSPEYLSQCLQNNSCLFKPVKSDDPWKLNGVPDAMKFQTATTRESGDDMRYIKKYCGGKAFHDAPRISFSKSLDLRLERILSQNFVQVHKPPDDRKRQNCVDGCLTDFPSWVPTYKSTETLFGKNIPSRFENFLSDDFPKTFCGVRRGLAGTSQRWDRYRGPDACILENAAWLGEHKLSSDRNFEFSKFSQLETPSRGLEKWQNERTSGHCYHSTRSGLLGGSSCGILKHKFLEKNGFFSEDDNVASDNAIREDDDNVVANSVHSGLIFKVRDEQDDGNERTNERFGCDAVDRISKRRDSFLSGDAGSPLRKHRSEKDVGIQEECNRRRRVGGVSRSEPGLSEQKAKKDVLTEATDVFYTALTSVNNEHKAGVDDEGAKDVTLDDISESFGSESYHGEAGGEKIVPAPKQEEPKPTSWRKKPKPTSKLGESFENKTTKTLAVKRETSRNRQSPDRRDFCRSIHFCSSGSLENNKYGKAKFKHSEKNHEKIDILLPSVGLNTTKITSFDPSPILGRKKKSRQPHQELDVINIRRPPYVPARERTVGSRRVLGGSPNASAGSKSPRADTWRAPKFNTFSSLASDRVLCESMARTENEWLSKHTRLMNECVKERQHTSRARVQRLVRRTEDIRESVSDLSVDLDKMEKQLENVKTLQQGYIGRAKSAVRLLEKKCNRDSTRDLEKRDTARSRRSPVLELKGPKGSVSPEGVSGHDTGTSVAKVTQGLRSLVSRTKTGRNSHELNEMYSYFVNKDDGRDLNRGNNEGLSLSSQKPQRKYRHRNQRSETRNVSRDEQYHAAERNPSLGAETSSGKLEGRSRTALKSTNVCAHRKGASVNFSKRISARRTEEAGDTKRDFLQSGYETEEEETETECGDTYRVRSRGLGEARMLGAYSGYRKDPEISRRLKTTASSSSKMTSRQPHMQESLGNRSKSEKTYGKNRCNDRKDYDVRGKKASEVSKSKLNTTFTICEV